jgi:hypothetical protein
MLATLTVQAGQKLLGLGRGLDSSIIHAGIVTKGGDAFSSRIGFPNIMVTHAIATGIQTQRLDLILRTGYRSALIYRPTGPLVGSAKQAAATAERWARPSAQHNRMAFATRKALMAGFGSSSYGAQAQQRAAEYHQYANTDGGPPSLHDNSVRTKSMFCSMFTVAVYQAALGPQVTSSLMGIDARNTSPMKLADFLRQKGFVQAGHVFQMPGSSDIHVVDGHGTEIEAPMLFFA